jgi:hypothetical protein
MGDKITKLSQAIRLGATFRPQCRGLLFTHKFGDVRSCAMGAAWEAITGTAEYVDLVKAKRILMKRFDVTDSCIEDIQERNDQLGQTREQIADWLEAQGL